MNQFEEDDYPTTNNKVIKIFRNGNSDLSCEVILPDRPRLSDIRRQLQQKWDTHFPQLRLFNSEGVESLEDDLEYLKAGSILFASKGEEFDQSFQLGEYEIIKDIGEGGFGKVVLGKHKQTKELVAIKMVKSGMITNAQDVDMIFREARALKTLCHENIVKIYNAFFMQNMQTVYIMEFLEGGELLALLQEKGHFTETEARHYFKQLVSAIQYCHSKRIIHRDLKLENLLLTAKGSGVIKAIDFGISGFSSDFNPENADAGSLRYMAPELLKQQDKAVSPLVDVWAMGIILYGMLFGTLPFTGNTNKEIISQISEGQVHIPPAFKNKISSDCLDCLFRALEPDPKRRISAQELLNHPFLEENPHILIQQIEKVQLPSNSENPSPVETKQKKSTIQFAPNIGVKKTSQSNVVTPSNKKPMSGTNSPMTLQQSKTPTSGSFKQQPISKFNKK